MDEIINIYNTLCKTPSDINEHLPTLFSYAKECDSIIETGVRGCVSSWALLYGLMCNNKAKKKIFMNDINECDISLFLNYSKILDIDVFYKWQNNLDLDLNERYDMIFIDTWHVYGQLKRELNKFVPHINKYIIMHDTTVDEIDGETVRNGWNAKEQSIKTGIPVDEITKGLGLAIVEFLDNNLEWEIDNKFINNNGLTILKRKDISNENVNKKIPRIIDAFLFYNEIDLLYYRISTLYNVVDVFIIVEATNTFVGNSKPLYYKENQERFSKFKDKILLVTVNNLNNNPNIKLNEQWINEAYQRDCIKHGINELKLDDNDMIIISDVDEIPNRDVLYQLKTNPFNFSILALEQDLYYCNLNNICKDKWYASVILTYGYYKNKPEPNNYRNNPSVFKKENIPLNFIKNAGWHLSYFGDIESIKNKILNYSHQENNIKNYMDKDKIRYRIKNNIDLFDRKNIDFEYISIKNNKNLPIRYDVYLKNFYKEFKNIAFFVRHFSERGTEVAIYDYAHYNETILNNKSFIVYFSDKKLNSINFPILKQSFNKFKNRFSDRMIEINEIEEMEKIIDNYEIDYFYTLTHGGKDIYQFENKNIWKNCKTIKHSNFNTSYPESDYYLCLDQTLNEKDNSNYKVIPHIVHMNNIFYMNNNLRSELNIPDNCIVFGRYGGFNEFNIEYVYESIKNVLENNIENNIYFLFMNTKPFYNHKNIIYLEPNTDIEFKIKFINTCDAMIHARKEGETFGLSIGEFSFFNKPVITSISQIDNAHIRILGDQAIIYNNSFELENILKNFRYIICDKNNFDSYKKYNPEYVMNLFPFS
jgi:beta-1,4-mannosyl-glycoprotein beta-1,4-N-acetylglucosaminyltransferase